MNNSEQLKDTLNLPKTDFPMRANSVVREPQRLSHWQNLRVYEKIIEKNIKAKILFFMMAHLSLMGMFMLELH